MFKLTAVAAVLAVCQALPQNFPNFGNNQAKQIVGTLPVVPTSTPRPLNYNPNVYEREQNRAAKYEFNSNIDDHISDLTHDRMETRDGLKVMGSYSYSDGYVKRTVHYEADEKGYRVTGQEAVPLNLEGPQVDLTGTASVSSAAHGRTIAYRVQSVPIPGPVPKIIN